jgi:exodeoxyribonuclease-3
MKLITWNVNSIRQRLPRLLALLQRHRPHLVCLQETKVVDQSFPFAALEQSGYHAAVFGQKGYNGVALLARQPLAAVARGFEEEPTPGEARVIAGRLGDLQLVNVYVVNGKSPGSEAFAVKLRWLEALRRWIERQFDPGQPLVIAGDFNVAPDDRDVHDPELWQGRLLCTDDERLRLRALCDWGLSDLFRLHHDAGGHFSWWDYRQGAFRRDRGVRIDLLLGTAPIAARCVVAKIDRAERDPGNGEGKPSDHAPVIATLG